MAMAWSSPRWTAPPSTSAGPRCRACRTRSCSADRGRRVLGPPRRKHALKLRPLRRAAAGGSTASALDDCLDLVVGHAWLEVLVVVGGIASASRARLG